MAQRSYAGSYLERQQGAAAAIEGVSASASALVGGTYKGPTEPRLVNGWPEFVREYGGEYSGSIVAHAANIYFNLGGSRLWVQRCVAADAVKAQAHLTNAVTDEDTGEDGDNSTTAFSFTLDESPVRAGSLVVTGPGLASTLTIETVAVADLSDGETVTITDGNVTRVFAFDTGGHTLLPGQTEVDVSGDTDADDVRDTFGAVIEASDLDVTVDVSTAGTIVLTNNSIGAAGTLTASDTVTDAGFTLATVSGINAPVLNDDGDGTLSGTGTGTIDYETGEVTCAFSTAPRTGNITATYSYELFEFTMRWEGVAGNSFRVEVTGSGRYEDPATASFSRHNVAIVETDQSGRDTVRAQYTDVVLSDPTSDSYLPTVVNDAGTGSADVTCVALNAEVPAVLSGAATASEALTLSPAYDGSEKAFTATLANEPIHPTTVEVTLNFPVTGESVGATGSATYTGTLANAPVKPGSVYITDGTLEVGDDGSGALTGDVAVGVESTINYTTGAYSVTFTSATTGAVTTDYLEADLILTDNGVGGLEVAAASTSGNTLNTNGSNLVDYDDGSISFSLTRAPDASSAKATSVQTADYYTAPAATIATATMTGGSDGSALTRSRITAAGLEADGLGIYGLDEIDENMKVVIPDLESDEATIADLITFEQNRDNRFCVYSSPEGYDMQRTAQWRKQNGFNTEFGVCVWNRIRVSNLSGTGTVLFPPGAAWAARASFVATRKNISKTPAGIQDGALSIALGTEFKAKPEDTGILREAGVIPIVNSPQVGGVAIWGAESLTIGGELEYAAQGLTYQYLARTVYNRGWRYTFEDVGVATFARVRADIEQFLTSEREAGTLRGRTPSESFFVVCDESNNDLTSNAIILDWGVALKKPGIFVVFRTRILR
jgi:hypothetical protein